MKKPGVIAIALPKGPAGGQPTDGSQQDTTGLGEPDGPDDMTPGEDCVSLKSLAMPDPDSGDQMANPEVGDRVNYQVEGTVTRIEGDNAYVKRETINGEPVEDDDNNGQDDQGNEDDQERQDLGGMASQMGGMS